MSTRTRSGYSNQALIMNKTLNVNNIVSSGEQNNNSGAQSNTTPSMKQHSNVDESVKLAALLNPEQPNKQSYVTPGPPLPY